MKIAVNRNASYRNGLLDSYIETMGIEAEKVYCNSAEEQLFDLKSGAADVLLSVNLSLPSEVKSIANFSPQPFYFATTKGNVEIVNALNTAILQLSEAYPTFQINLFDKYFKSENDEIVLSEEQKKYIQDVGVLKVGVTAYQAPFQYKNEKTGEFEGLAIDVLNYISEQTGLAFELVEINSALENGQKIENGEVDILLTVPRSYRYARNENIILSVPYIEVPVVLVYKKDVSLDKILSYTSQELIENMLQTNYQTIQEYLEAVNNGKTEYYMENAFTIQYYIKKNNYKNIAIHSYIETASTSYCLGLSANLDTDLLSILNYSINSISNEKLQSFLFHADNQSTEISLGTFIENNTKEVYGTLIFLILIITVIITIYMKKYLKLARLKELENVRYTQLSEVSRECIFEYSYKSEKLSFTRRGIFANRRPKDISEYREECKQYLMKDKNSLESFFGWLAAKKDGSGDILLSFEEGSPIWCNITSKMIYDKDGTAVSMIGRIIDVHYEKEEKTQLVHLAQEDSLTKLLNSAFSRQYISKQLGQQGENQKSAFLILDIDYFKKINDSYGHFVGDETLIEIAEQLKRIFSNKENIIGRVGGDEFVVYLKEGKSKEKVEEQCQILKETLKKIQIQQVIGLTISLGGVITCGKAEYEEVYKQADKMMYQVKEKGRDGFEIKDLTDKEE